MFCPKEQNVQSPVKFCGRIDKWTGTSYEEVGGFRILGLWDLMIGQVGSGAGRYILDWRERNERNEWGSAIHFPGSGGRKGKKGSGKG